MGCFEVNGSRMAIGEPLILSTKKDPYGSFLYIYDTNIDILKSGIVRERLVSFGHFVQGLAFSHRLAGLVIGIHNFFG